MDFTGALVVSEQTEGGDDGGLEPVTGGAALEFTEVGVEDAGAAAGDQAVEEAAGQHVLDGIAPIMATDTAVGWIAADELADGLAIAEFAENDEGIASLGAVFRVTAASEDLFDCFLGDGFCGGDGVSEIGDVAKTERKILADDTGDAAAPDVADAITHGEIGVVSRVAGNIAHTLHDVGTEVGDRLGMVDPDGDAAIVFDEFVERTTGMGAGGREVAEGMQAIDVAAVNESAEFLAFGLGCIPVGQLAGCHIEIERVANFQADARSHGGFLGGVEETHQLEIGRRIGRFIEVAADGESGGQELEEKD